LDRRERALVIAGRRRPVLHGVVLGVVALAASLSFFASKAIPFGDEPSSSPITGLALPSIGAPRPQQETVMTSEVLSGTLRREEVGEAFQVFAGEAPAAAFPEGAAAGASVAPPPLFELYTVLDGDTASAIAARYGVDLDYLLWANPDLRDGELLGVGQTLIVPSGNGILHHVRYGETLSDIAARYGVSVETVLNWTGNQIVSADQVVEDQMVFVPNGLLPAPVAEPTPAPVAEPAVIGAPIPAAAPPPSGAPAPASATGLIWPVYGPISSYMDASHPLGIDIDMYNSPNAPIGAATSGTVTFAGGSPCCSYGLYVVVVSPDGIETLYAHMSSMNVSAGQQVTQGDVLGYAGCTGYCTGNHLHFEVIDNGVRVDPLAYLP
jgi:murein DD-endopeptidase MepM/ murein hydrolase activator NlpD